MPVPRSIREHLAPDSTSHPGLPGLPLEGSCMGSVHHSPRPIVLHEVDLDDGSHVVLCGTCKDNLDTLRYLMRTTTGPVPWPVRREFGNTIRALAGC